MKISCAIQNQAWPIVKSNFILCSNQIYRVDIHTIKKLLTREKMDEKVL